MRILEIFFILILVLVIPFAFSESIVDVIKNNDKFQHFDTQLLDLIELGELTEYRVQIFASNGGVYNDEKSRQDAASLIESLLISRYDAVDVIRGNNSLLGPYVEAIVPVDNLPNIANLDFVGVILPTQSKFVQDDSELSIGDKIRNNPKLHGFHDNMIKAIEHNEIDVIHSSISLSTYEWDRPSDLQLHADMEKLVTILKTDHNVKDDDIYIRPTSVSGLIPPQALLDASEFSYVTRVSVISGQGGDFALKYNDSESEGIVKFFDHNYAIPYDIPYKLSSGKISFFGLLVFDMKIPYSENFETLEISIPREIIDPFDSYGEFLGEMSFSPRSDYELLEESCDYKKFKFTFNASDPQIVIWGGAPPEDINPERDAWFKSLAEDRFKIDDEYDVIIHHQNVICDFDFIEKENKLQLIINGHTGVTSTISVMIPKHILDGEFQVFLNGNLTEFDFKQSNLYNKIEFSPLFDENNLIVEIIGSDLFSHETPLPVNSFVGIATDKKHYERNEPVKIIGYLSEPTEYTIIDYANIELINPSGDVIHQRGVKSYLDTAFEHQFSIGSPTIGFIPGTHTLQATYQDSQYRTEIIILEESSSNLLIGQPSFVDSFGNTLDFLKGKFDIVRILESNQIQIATNITNYNTTSSQLFAYQLDVKRLDAPYTFETQWITGDLNAGQTVNAAMSWFPEDSGLYAVSVSVGTTPDNIIDSRTQVIVIGDAYVSVLPEWIKNTASNWSNGYFTDEQFLKGIGYLVDRGMIHVNNEVSTKSEIIPQWIKNNAKWWSDGTISEYEFVTGIKYLVEHNIFPIS